MNRKQLIFYIVLLLFSTNVLNYIYSAQLTNDFFYKIIVVIAVVYSATALIISIVEIAFYIISCWKE